MKRILERSPIELDPIHKKMVISGWGINALENSAVEKITYLSDGLKIKGYLAYPKAQTQKFPCIIWCRGGFGNAGAIDEFNASGIFGQIASWGYVVFASQYRGNSGSEGIDDFGGQDVNDVLNLIPLADEVTCADNSIWGIEGWSRGGMMTYLSLTKTEIFKAAIVIGGIANLRCNSDESPFMKKLYDTSAKHLNSLEKNSFCETRSIVNFPEKLPRGTNILLLHGTKDNRVLPHDSVDLSYKLLENDIPFRLVLLEGGDHFLKSHKNEVSRFRKDWFDKYLKGIERPD